MRYRHTGTLVGFKEGEVVKVERTAIGQIKVTGCKISAIMLDDMFEQNFTAEVINED